MHKRAKDAALTQMFFFCFYIVYFPNNVLFVMTYTERHPLILENLKTIELLSSFKVFLKCMARIA